MTRVRRPAFATLALTIVALAACSDDSTGPTPAPFPSLTIEAPAADVFQGDVATLRAVVRNAAGEVVSGVPVTWEVNDPARAEVAAGGEATFLAPGAVTITARAGSLAASRTFDVRRLSVLVITVLPTPLQLTRGDVRPVGVRVQGEGGRDVTGRVVTLSSDNPAVAFVDAAGRVHGIAPGVATVRATAEGVTGTTRVEVSDEDTTLELWRVGGARTPLLVGADSVWVDGQRRYHEVYIEGGEFTITGSPTPRYAIDVRYAEYDVVTSPAGQRSMTLQHVTREEDHGLVQRDARGDLALLSEYIGGLRHTAVPVSTGMQVLFRIPGENTTLDLLYRRF